MANLKRVLLITTGGTIASNPTPDGLAPQLSGRQILDFVPEIKDLAEIKVLPLLNLDSTNMGPRHWLQLKEAIRVHYEDYDAFVITHGTDTLAYTAAGLSYLIQNSAKPIVLTGSQQSIARRDTDARKNLYDTILYAQDPAAHGVKVVFDGQILLGTRAKKTHTKSYAAFKSIDYPPVAVVRGDKILYFIEEQYKDAPIFYHALNPNVAVLKLVPGLKPSILEDVAKDSDAIIIEGFGSGGLPNLEESNLNLLARKLLGQGKLLVMSTQVQHEGSDMSLYQVGHDLSQTYGMPEALTMTIEALTAKLMWILARTKDFDRAIDLLYTKIDHDIL